MSQIGVASTGSQRQARTNLELGADILSKTLTFSEETESEPGEAASPKLESGHRVIGTSGHRSDSLIKPLVLLLTFPRAKGPRLKARRISEISLIRVSRGEVFRTK